MGKKQEAKTFKVGDMVKWSSQAAGTWKDKIGKVIEVGVPGQRMTNGRMASTRHYHIVEVTVIHSRGQKTVKYLPTTSAMSLLSS